MAPACGLADGRPHSQSPSLRTALACTRGGACSILEFSRNDVNVELWDVSGDRRFDSGWAAVNKDTTGVVIVFDGDDPDQERTVGLW